MSFDTEFDYTNVKNNLDGKILELNQAIDAGNSEIDMYGNISDYDDLTVNKIINLRYTNDVYVKMLNAREILKIEIEDVENMNTPDQDTLYNFWGNVLSNTNETKAGYMKRMLFNYDEGLIGDATEILNDNELSQSESGAIGELICQKYPIKSQVYILRDEWF